MCHFIQNIRSFLTWFTLKKRVLHNSGTNLHITGILCYFIDRGMTWSICISVWKRAFRHRWFRWIVNRHFTVTCFPISTLGEHGDTWHSYCRVRSSVQLCTLTMSFRGQNNRTILPLTSSTFYCFCLIPWPWKHRFCHLIGQFWSCIYWVMPETEFRMMAELICI